MVGTPLRHSFYSDAQSSAARTRVAFEAGLAHPTLGPSTSVPRVKIEYDVTEQDSGMSESSTPATALPLATPPFYTPMETPMRARPPQLLSLPSGVSLSPGGWLGGTHFALPASSLSPLGPFSSFPLRLPNRAGSLLPSIGEQERTSDSLSSSSVPFGVPGTVEEAVNDTGTKLDPRTEPSPVDDYVNASYVQPLCTRKRYIATQGPLPSTYVDFWTCVFNSRLDQR